MAAHIAPCEVIKRLIEEERVQSFKIVDFNETVDISYEQFLENYLIPNRPCLFCPKSTEIWTSRNEWVCEFDGSPNFGFFEMLGDCIVPVANCKEKQFSSHPKQDMMLKEYMKYWREYKDSGYPDTQPCLYLKDWHFTKAFPDYRAYTTPVYFQSDWLNEFWDTEAGGDDYRFVYMGPKGTWTSFHADVYRSYSWSANICGRKLWIFYPPGEEDQFRDRYGNIAYDVTSPELQDIKYPNYSRENDHRIEIIQEQGQIIFVPSGWHHQVYNLEDTISINHNWLNGCNIDICWQHLKDNLENVKKEISDCKDMEGWYDQCQLILKASAGIDYRMFYKLLQTIAKHRMKKLQITKCSECCDSHIDIKPRTSDTVMNSESDLRNKHSESEPRPKIDDKAGVSNMEIDHNKINECHTSNSLSHGKTRLCDSKPVCSNVCPQKSSSVQAEVDCVDITMSSEEKTDKPKEMSPKYTIDKTVEASEVICHMEPMDKSDKTRTIETEVVFEAGTVVSSDMSKTGDMFRHLNLHPKHPDDNDHMVFDLFRIESVLQEVLHDEDHKIISTNEELESARQLLKRIQNSVNDYDKK